MKKKWFVIPTTLVAVMSISGCNSGVQSEYILGLESEVAELNSKITELEAENSNLTSSIDELENGAEKILSNVLSAYETKNYENAIKFANNLHNKFNGTTEDKKGQEIKKKAQDALEKLKEQEKAVAEKKKAEEEKKAAEAAKSEEEKIHEILRVSSLEVAKINTADGVDVKIIWTNRSDKTIKYIKFTVEPYNAVNDVVTDRISGVSQKRLQVTGPIESGDGSGSYGHYWEAVWYNSTVKTLKFTQIDIDYMDGTSESISGKSLDYVIW